MIIIRVFLLFVLSVFVSGCASVYTQSLRGDAASISVQSPRLIKDEKYRPFVAININGKRVVRSKKDFERDPETSYVRAIIDPGNHEIKIEVTAYNDARAKYGHTSLSIELRPSASYQLSAIVPDVVSESLKSDSWAHLKLINVANGKELLNEKIILKDNGFRSVAEDPTIIVPIIL